MNHILNRRLFDLQIYYENVKIALKSIRANIIRSILTVIGVAIGVFAVIMIIAVVTGLKDSIRSQIIDIGGDLLDIIPGNTEEFGFASEQLFATFEKSEVEAVAKRKDLYKYFSEMYNISASFEYRGEKKNGYCIGMRPDYFELRDISTLSGELFNNSHMKNADRVVVIGPNVAEDLYQTPDRAVGKIIKINGREFKIIGVLERQDFKIGAFDMDDASYIPSTTADRVFDDARLSEMFLMVNNTDELESTKREVEKILNEEMGKDEFSILTQDDLLEVVDEVTGMITAALGGLASISLLVGGIGIMNIMLVSVTERTKEIGLRKAVGAEDAHIRLQFLTETVVLSMLGGAFGLGLAFLTSVVLEKYFSISSLITLPTVLGAIGFSMIVGVIFGTVPAIKASNKDPIESLRYNP